MNFTHKTNFTHTRCTFRSTPTDPTQNTMSILLLRKFLGHNHLLPRYLQQITPRNTIDKVIKKR
jgi:hypothetical protein